MQLWWAEARPGARLTIPVRVPAAGTYEVVGHFTRGPEFGNVRVRVNARDLPATVEGYSPTVLPTGPISLGRAAFQRGANQIAVEIVGKDPRSQGYSEGYLVGVDGFLLRR